jgi:spore coat protein U-like protein
VRHGLDAPDQQHRSGHQRSGGWPQMRQGSFTFRYNLYLEAGGTLIFGDGTRGTSLYANPVPPAKTLVTVMMYGRIPAHQYAERIGAYADTLTVQIQF